MKFATKMILGTWVLIALCFSLGGTYMIQKNFSVAFDNVVENNQRQHIMSRYSLESNVRNNTESGETFSTKVLQRYAEKLSGYGQADTGIILAEVQNGTEYKIIYKNIKTVDASIQAYIEDAGTIHYEVYEKEHRHYMLMASRMDFYEKSKVKLINRYDISSTFEERNRQVRDFIRLDIAVMLIALLFLYMLSHLLTRNIKKLGVMSSKIAEGEYGMRTHIKSSDEIGELSRNFDLMAESIEEHIQQLERDVQVREEFVSDFSHELKTPLTSMMGYSQLLLGNSLEEEKRERAADYIYRECNRLRNLSNTLLKMLGIVEEHIEKKWIYTDWIAEQVESVCEVQMANAKLTLDVENDMLYTDAELVVTLLKNLIHNGDKACRSNQGSETSVPVGKEVERNVSERNGGNEENVVSVTGRTETENYVFVIRDTGCGMAQEEIEKITQPFYMIDKSRTRSEGGSGVGLAICDKICQFLNIDMKIESEIGNGTTVTLTFGEWRKEEGDA